MDSIGANPHNPSDEPRELALARFARLTGHGAVVPSLWEAAFALSEIVYPAVDPEPYNNMLDEFSWEVEARCNHRSLDEFVKIYNHLFFNTWGFEGNAGDYYNPDNSLLSAVLESRKGIPISLTVIYAEIAMRAGFPVSGVNFPSHFLARVGRQDPIIVDVFGGGTTLTETDCQRMLEELTGRRVAQIGPFCQPASNRAVLIRMLNNLSNIYENAEDPHLLLEVLDRLALLLPADAGVARKKAGTAIELGHHPRARHDLTTVLLYGTDTEIEEALALLEKLAPPNDTN